MGDDEGNDGLDPDTIIAREEPVALQSAQDLERALGDGYQCEAYRGYW